MCRTPMLMETMVRDFVLYLEAEKGYSPKTTEAYCYDLRQFFDFMARENVESSLNKVATEVEFCSRRAGSDQEGAIGR